MRIKIHLLQLPNNKVYTPTYIKIQFDSTVKEMPPSDPWYSELMKPQHLIDSVSSLWK